MTAIILALALAQAAPIDVPPRPARATRQEADYMWCLFRAVGKSYYDLGSGIAPYENALAACAASRAKLSEALEKALRKKRGLPDPEPRLEAAETYLRALDSAFVTHGAVKTRPVEGRDDTFHVAVDYHPTRSVAYYEACLKGWAAGMDLTAKSDSENVSELRDKCIRGRPPASRALAGGVSTIAASEEAYRKLEKMEEGWVASYRAEQQMRPERTKTR